MHPVLFRIGVLSIYSYGTMVAIGFIISAFLIYTRAPQSGLDRDKMADLAVYAAKSAGRNNVKVFSLKAA